MQVCAGAMLACSMGAAPSSLVVLPVKRVLTTTPAATIMDHVPVLNVPPFGMCSSPANPAVAAATAAAMGTPTPAPCVPVTPAPWVLGAPTVLIGGEPALDDSAKLTCTWGGMISISSPGQTSTMIP